MVLKPLLFCLASGSNCGSVVKSNTVDPRRYEPIMFAVNITELTDMYNYLHWKLLVFIIW